MKQLFFVFMLAATPLLAEMRYDKAKNFFFLTNLIMLNDQIEYNMHVVNFLQEAASYFNGIQQTQAAINQRFNANVVTMPCDINNYIVIFIGTLMARVSLASIEPQHDLQQPQTFTLFNSLCNG